MEDTGRSLAIPAPSLARFACDFCRQKKIKCTRELPKCGICKPWPSSCIYSRQAPALNDNGKRPQVAESSGKSFETSIEDRLERLERTVKSLNGSIDEALRLLSAAPQQRSAAKRTVKTSSLTNPSEEDQSNPQLYIGPSHSFSFLEEATAGIERLPRQDLKDTHQGVISEINKVSSCLTTARIGNPVETSTDFHVPSRAAGYALLSKFLEQAELGEPFFSFPPDEILRQVVFEPHKVREKAWIVIFNYILLATISTEKDEQEDNLRQNAQLALNDSRLFLEPSLANVQAFSLLAVHGEDFAAPNISWMLLSHACRQAEALGLHIQSKKDSVNDYQHKLCLFWMLFTLDKSCALAFGRPAFLPFALYHHVPLPDHDFMQKFSPHDTKAVQNERQSSQCSDFGASILKSIIELAKLTSEVLEYLGAGSLKDTKDEIRSKLENWFLTTNMALTQAMESERTSADVTQIREMNLGINSNKFQYLHILTLLLKGDRCSDLRLSCAREAIFLLPSLVSNWGSVYNGVIWQLLYYPFAPFLVIFENIIHQSSHYPTLEQDLHLLTTTVTYFTKMRSQMRLLAGVCSKLQHTATVFLQLAQSHARRSTSTNPAGDTTCSSRHRNDSGIDDDGLQSGDYLIDADLSDKDFINYLNLLPIDMNATSRILENELHLPGPNFSGRENESYSTYIQRPTLDRAFDWFSWDDYYGSPGN